MLSRESSESDPCILAKKENNGSFIFMNDSGGEPPLRGKTILLVNAGSPQKSFILKRMKELGLSIIALHPHQEKWAEDFIDHWILTEGKGRAIALNSLKEFCTQHPSIHLDGAITFWEEDVPLLAEICTEMGFVGNSVETAINTRDKFDMQDILRRNGRPAINQHFVSSARDLEQAMNTVEFPAIIKPLFGTDSLSVIYFENRAAARAAYQHAMTVGLQSYEVLYTYDKGLFVYQEFIPGKEFSIECYCQNGIPHVIGIHEKTSMDLPFFMETGDFLPPRISQEEYKTLAEEAKVTLLTLGVQSSLAHVEMKLGPHGPQIIEVASRMGGYYTYQTVKRVHGFDLVRAGCEIALGIEVSDKPTLPQSFMIGKFFIPSSSGRISGIHGLEALKDPRILDAYFIKKVGEEILIPPQGYEAAGWVLIEGSTLQEAEESIESISSAVRIDVIPHKVSTPALSRR